MSLRPKDKRTNATSVKGKTSAKTQKAKLRIISGKWRSRQLPIPDLEGLRPTPDRVRETVFNWISPYVAGANCADLFCGSGALGLEALSREAKHCTFVDASRVVTQQIQQNLTTLNCSNATVSNQSALTFLEGSTSSITIEKVPFDIVFLDPPFRKDWIEKILPLLNNGWLQNKSLVYLEAEKEMPLPELDSSWTLLKEKNAGQLTYRLFQINSQS